MRALPDDFRWYSHLVGGKDYGDTILRLGWQHGFQIARVTLRQGGQDWLSEVRRYAYPRPHVVTRSRDRAIVWASRWAAANEEAIWQALRDYERRNGLTPMKRRSEGPFEAPLKAS